MTSKKHQSGQSAMEFIALVVFVAMAVVIFYPHLRNYMAGQWHAAGEAISFGMVYQGDGACAQDAGTGIWYNEDCFFSNSCDVACHSSTSNSQACTTCLGGCSGGC